MSSKIILGLLMGLFGGSSAKVWQMGGTVHRNGWLTLSIGSSQIIVLAWVIAIFVKYPAEYGLMAIAEVAVGAILSGFTPMIWRVNMAMLSFPVLAIAWFLL